MTTNVNIHNVPGHHKVKLFRRHKETGVEQEVGEAAPGDMVHHVSLWEDVELVIREVAVPPTYTSPAK